MLLAQTEALQIPGEVPASVLVQDAAERTWEHVILSAAKNLSCWLQNRARCFASLSMTVSALFQQPARGASPTGAG